MDKQFIQRVAGFITSIVTRIAILAIWAFAFKLFFNGLGVCTLIGHQVTFVQSVGILVCSEILRG